MGDVSGAPGRWLTYQAAQHGGQGVHVVAECRHVFGNVEMLRAVTVDVMCSADNNNY